MSRATKAYASAYDRSRFQVARVRRQETRTFTVDFTQVIGDDPIASVTWHCNNPTCLSMSSAAIDGALTTVEVSCQLGGTGALKATAETEGGATYSQAFVVDVRDCPGFPDETAPTTGVTSLTVEA